MRRLWKWMTGKCWHKWGVGGLQFIPQGANIIEKCERCKTERIRFLSRGWMQ